MSFLKANLNWYPGHIEKAWKEIGRKNANIIIEVRDGKISLIV